MAPEPPQGPVGPHRVAAASDGNVGDVDYLDGLAVQHAPSRDTGSHQPIREPLIGRRQRAADLVFQAAIFPRRDLFEPVVFALHRWPFGFVGSVILTRIFLRSIGMPVCASRASQLRCSSARPSNPLLPDR